MYSTSQDWKDHIYKSGQCEMNIYIDNILINPDYIFDFKKGGILFDGELKLGSTPSQYIEFKIDKRQLSETPKIVRVEYGIQVNESLTVGETHKMLLKNFIKKLVKNLTSVTNEVIPIGIYNIDDYTNNDDGTITIKALDNMIKFEFNYDGSILINQNNGSATLFEVAQDICTKAGVLLGQTTFINSEKKIAVYDNTISAREYIGYIAEASGTFACIGRDGKLYFRKLYQDTTEIPLELFGEYKWGEEYKLTKLSYEDGVRDYKFGNDTRNNLWINQDNLFIVDEEQVENIYNNVSNLTINTFEGKTIIDPAIDIGDKIIIDGKPIVYQGEMTLEGRFIADIKSKIQIKQKEETSTKTESQKTIVRRIKSEINQVEGRITQLVEETEENTEKLSIHEQTIDSITDSVSSIETNLSNNYYTKTQTNSQIEQKADTITSTVTRQISTAKSEAIDSANSSTDNKLSDYYTKSETRSQITQTADEINSVVSTKVGNNEIISKINQSSESISINANRINIEGKKVKFKTNTETTHTFSKSDIDKINNYILGTEALTQSEKELYDMNNDGIITIADSQLIVNGIVENGGSATNGGTYKDTGTFEINPDATNRSIILRDKNDEILTSIGLRGIQTIRFGAESIKTNVINTDTLSSSGSVSGNTITSSGITKIGTSSARHLAMGGSSNYSWIDSRNSSETVQNNIVIYDDRIYTQGSITATNFVGKWNGIEDDHITNNTTDTWVPVYSSGKLQHRVIGTGAVYGATTLYSNSSGTTGTVTLSSSASNFEYLELFYKNGSSFSGSTKVYPASGVTTTGCTPRQDANTTGIMISTVMYYINGTTITQGRNGQINISSSGNIALGSGSSEVINLLRVVGYKST